VGLLEGGRGISWTVLNKSILGWIFTLVISGLFSALLMALGIYTPNLNSLEAVNKIKATLDETAMEQIARYQKDPICGNQAAALNVRCCPSHSTMHCVLTCHNQGPLCFQFLFRNAHCFCPCWDQGLTLKVACRTLHP
jgi:hypothetical protein